jgi:hypothetical protein
MVPRPCASATAALVAPERLRKKVSSGSSNVSPKAWTVTAFVVSPGEKVSVPAVPP